MKTIFVVLAMLISSSVFAEERPKDLKGIEAALKSSPDDPMLHYGKCQFLFKDGKEQEAIDHASVTMAKFILAKKNLLGSESVPSKRRNIASTCTLTWGQKKE